MGIALAGAVLLTVATSFAAAAVANDRAAPGPNDRASARGQDRTTARSHDRATPGETERRAGEDRVARWRIVDQPTTRWEGRGSDRLASRGAAPGGEVVPVLPLGAGLTSLGLGIGLLGYRLRQG